MAESSSEIIIITIVNLHEQAERAGQQINKVMS